jgi:hypothetical protein
MKKTPKLPKRLTRIQVNDFYRFLNGKYGKDCWCFERFAFEESASDEDGTKYDQFHSEPLLPTDTLPSKVMRGSIAVYENEMQDDFLYYRDIRRQLGAWWRSQHE